MAGQAQELGKLRYEKAHYEKSARHWEERALNAEQATQHEHERWELSSEHNQQLHEQLDFAKEFIQEAAVLILGVWNNTVDMTYGVEDLAAFGRWRQTYRDFYLKSREPAEQQAPYSGLVELYPVQNGASKEPLEV